MILRGGKAPNHDAASVAAGLQGPGGGQTARHPDGGLQPCQQQQAAREAAGRGARDIADQIKGGSRSVFGLMIESHLVAGAQKFRLARNHPVRWNMARASPMPAWAGTIPCVAWANCRRPYRRAGTGEGLMAHHGLSAQCRGQV